MELYTAKRMKAAEAYTASHGGSYLGMMERAGCAAADQIQARYGRQGKRFAVLCGKGNNGGDGFVVARRLHEAGERVTMYRPLGDPSSPDAQTMFCRAVEAGVPEAEQLEQADVVVDALFGTGFRGRVPASAADIIAQCTQQSLPVIALDVPSGIMADTGEIEGPAFHATLTIAFHAAKPGHVIYPAAELCAEVITQDIGIPAEADQWQGEQIRTIETDDVLISLPPRPKNSNKGTFGRAMCVCGSYGMAGAAVLSASACAWCGAGLVEVCAPASIYPPLAAQLVEQIFLPVQETPNGTISPADWDRIMDHLHRASACLVGCGMGQDETLGDFLALLLKTARCPVVLDADGINALAGHIHILKTAEIPVILTPHPGEMARLTGLDVQQVQAHRLQIARDFALTHQVTLILKGANTLIACPDGEVLVNTTGGSGLAKAGSGDVLAGMVTSFLAQGMPVREAAAAAVHLHGLAGDITARRLGERAMQASDLLTAFPEILRLSAQQ